jgi:hypothetical protein
MLVGNTGKYNRCSCAGKDSFSRDSLMLSLLLAINCAPVIFVRLNLPNNLHRFRNII